jgi:methylenetetrahydrofolate reductase (NADPH)
MEKQNISFEFFPPKSPEANQKLLMTAQQLKQVNPEFFSVTFGAGGTTRAGTVQTIYALQRELQVEVAPHISCIANTKAEIFELLTIYKQNNIKRIVALRGDIPSGMANSVGDFSYASELIEFIREQFHDHFMIEVGCYPEMHPQAENPFNDLNNFKKKVAAGANNAITQYFFNPDSYFRFVDECLALGISIPIIPGIMPLTNYQQITRFSKMCGAEIPRWIHLRLQALQDDPESLILFGTEVVTDLCETLIDNGVPGLHFYTLNRLEPTLTICKNLGLI